jgi:hypothetical protein
VKEDVDGHPAIQLGDILQRRISIFYIPYN